MDEVYNQADTAYHRAPEAREPTPDYDRTLTRFREHELLSLRQKLVRIPNRPKARAWAAVSGILLGAALGAIPAGIPLLSHKADLDSWILPVYAVAAGASLIMACICYLASRSMADERAVSLEEVREDLDNLLNFYNVPIPSAEKVPKRDLTKRILRGIGGYLRL